MKPETKNIIKGTESKESPCQEMIKKEVQADADGYYRIPSDLDLSGYPEGVVNSFLDDCKDLSKKDFHLYITLIKLGKIQIDCPDDDEVEAAKN